MIEALLPKVRRDILALLLTKPDEDLYLREIVRATGDGKGAVERELQILTKAGFLLREKRGNLTFYRANRDCSIFPELHGIMLKTIGLADVLRASLANVKGIRLAFIFGSMAKGTSDARSDVDVLIVSDTSYAEISGVLLSAQKRLGREIVPTVYSPDEFRQRILEKHHFLSRVLSEPKIMLIGTTDDIERLGKSPS